MGCNSLLFSNEHILVGKTVSVICKAKVQLSSPRRCRQLGGGGSAGPGAVASLLPAQGLAGAAPAMGLAREAGSWLPDRLTQNLHLALPS